MSDNFVLYTRQDDTQVLVRRQPVAGRAASVLLRIDPLRTGLSAAFLTREDALMLADALTRTAHGLPPATSTPDGPTTVSPGHGDPWADPASVDPWLCEAVPLFTPPAGDLELWEARAAYDRSLRRLVNTYAYRAAHTVIRAYPRAVSIDVDCIDDPDDSPGYTTLLAVLDGRGRTLASVDYNADGQFTALDARLSTELGALMYVAPPEDGWYGQRTLLLSDFLAW